MNGNYALDTNIVIALIDGNMAVRDRVAQADRVYIPSPVLGELYFGAYHSAKVAENVDRIENLVRWYPIMDVDEVTANTYGAIRSRLYAKGTPIPDNDIWIAALARQHGATVATRDQHFNAIDGLFVERW
jgi:tRNA(fMet)-specific endonuclease VapC